MYCVKCKKHTDTDNIQHVVTKNNRNMLRGVCVSCGSTKTQFVKLPEGGSFLNSTINSLPFEMHLPGHSFTGPGTKLKQRLNPDDTPKSWSKPINRVDASAYKHDLCYRENRDTKTRNEVCDRNMLKELDGIYNPTVRERFERGIVKPLIGTKKFLGLGIKKKLGKKN